MNAQHSKNSNEHYTPKPIIEAARNLMNGIELDPASCELANKVVQADRFYSVEDDALNMLNQKWKSRSLFLNPPGGLIKLIDGSWIPVERGGKSSQAIWWDKLLECHLSSYCQEAIFIAFSIELLGKRPNMLKFPICITSSNRTNKCVTGTGRVKFNKPNENGEGILAGNSPTHMNIIVYLPPQENSPKIRQFGKLFKEFGNVGIFHSF